MIKIMIMNPLCGNGGVDALRFPRDFFPMPQRGSGSETLQHLLLKKAAAFWAQKEGYRVCGVEVSLPNCNYRADVAAYRAKWRRETVFDPRSQSHKLVRENVVGQTAVFECKQARADFLKDSRSAQKALATLEKLHDRRENLERSLKVHYPNLRNGDSLFPEFESADLETIDHQTYRRTMRRISAEQNRLFGQTKFEKMRRWQCANLLYLVAPEGLIAPHEVPPGWGLLILPREDLAAHEKLGICPEPARVLEEENPDGEEQENLEHPLPPLPRLERKPEWIESRESTRLDLLQRLAATGTRRLNRDWAMNYEMIQHARGSGL